MSRLLAFLRRRWLPSSGHMIENIKEPHCRSKHAGKKQPVIARAFGSFPPRRETLKDSDVPNSTYIALGSNVGDRIANIERACGEMKEAGLAIKRTSCLYETPPMYVENQDSFVNAVVEVNVIPLSPTKSLMALTNKLGQSQ